MKTNTAQFELGKQIKQLRIAKGWTQPYLCLGAEGTESQGMICTVNELSRIENGKRRPHWNAFERLMQRLGEDPNKYFRSYALTAKEQMHENTKKYVLSLIRTNDMNATVIQREKIDVPQEIENIINELESDSTFCTNTANMQFSYHAKAYVSNAKQQFEKSYEHALTGIRLSKPYFNENNIYEYALYDTEIRLIVAIANYYSFKGIKFAHEDKIENAITFFEKANKVYDGLKKSVENNFIQSNEREWFIINITFNKMLSQTNMTKVKNIMVYDEALALADECQSLCIKYQNYSLLPKIILTKGEMLLLVGNRKESTEYFFDFYILAKNMGLTDMLNVIKDHFAKEYNFTYPESIYNLPKKNEG
ncbi:MAG: helix-turn-helix domain-containing protein, partial [Defluviitaleaceae bacterium]|nr:helix-turn-helix domain-containing protein [Defluviitaleaceae bacterium]MCL2275494.1 helix-turn-helix domain-containing protein [Defluviitaleaceae bacterium]